MGCREQKMSISLIPLESMKYESCNYILLLFHCVMCVCVCVCVSQSKVVRPAYTQQRAFF